MFRANGNTIKKVTQAAVWDYVYDMENLLVEVKKDGVTVALYGYDPYGRRLWKSVNNAVTYFAYSDEGLVAGIRRERGDTEELRLPAG
ncbi:hypothetical protein EPN96_08595 [bacterium]|nr:MAG: hypothetical protein EPN96_08595 [bacterium]